jgi:hypothetical protein
MLSLDLPVMVLNFAGRGWKLARVLGLSPGIDDH